MDRRSYMREYQRRRRAAYPDKAKAEGKRAYEVRKAREQDDPGLKARRKQKELEWRQANLEHLALEARRRYRELISTPEGREHYRELTRKGMQSYYGNPINRIKLRARWRASRALRDGRLTRQPCRDCNTPRTEMHHPNYLRALEVIWLCKAHHEREHVAC